MWKQFKRLMEEAGDGGDGGGDGAAAAGGLLGGGDGAAASTDGAVASQSNAGADAAAAAQVAQPADTGGSFKLNIYGDDGKLSEDFAKSIPEEYKGVEKIFGKYKSQEDLIKGIHSLSFMAKKGELGPLDPNAPDHVKQEYDSQVKSALGIPETAADYAIQFPEGTPDDAIDTEFVDSMKQFAHENNVTPEALNKFAPILMQREAAIHEGYANQDAQLLKSGMESLQKEYGSDFGSKIEAAKRGVMLADPDIDVANDPAFKHPTAVKLAIALAERTGDDRQPNASAAGGTNMNFREQSRDIVSNPNNQYHAAYHDSQHPQHDAAVKEKGRLSKLAHQNGQA